MFAEHFGLDTGLIIELRDSGWFPPSRCPTPPPPPVPGRSVRGIRRAATPNTRAHRAFLKQKGFGGGSGNLRKRPHNSYSCPLRRLFRPIGCPFLAPGLYRRTTTQNTPAPTSQPLADREENHNPMTSQNYNLTTVAPEPGMAPYQAMVTWRNSPSSPMTTTIGSTSSPATRCAMTPGWVTAAAPIPCGGPSAG